jgi:hypothetical protein
MVSTTLGKARPHPTWRLYIWPIAVLGPTIIAGWCVRTGAEFVLENAPGHVFADGRGSSVMVKAEFQAVRFAVETALQTEDYAPGDSGIWTLQTVPEGKQIGKAGFINSWKPSPFDRWRWDWRRCTLVAGSLEITIQLIGSDQPAETLVTIYLERPGGGVEQSEAPKLLKDLLEAAKSAAPAPAYLLKSGEIGASPAH